MKKLIGATVSNNLSICENCIVGVRGVVFKNLEESGTYVGIPVRKINDQIQLGGVWYYVEGFMHYWCR